MVGLYTAIALFSATIPTAIWLVFFLREDCHPEPKKLILYTFCIGGLMSLPVLALQIVFQNTILKIGAGALILILGLALIEEVFKYIGAYLAVNKDPAFDEPIDSMIYIIAAAMGFATVENLFIIGNRFEVVDGQTLLFTIGTLSLRFVGATLLHTLSSGLVGYYWAWGRIKNKLRIYVFKGLIFATVVHTFFNFLILKFQSSNLLVIPSIFLIIAAFFILNDFEKLKEEEKEELNQ